jgi:hypothetical protein
VAAVEIKGFDIYETQPRMSPSTREFTAALPALFAELVVGSPDPTKPTSMLNRGDPGLLASLESISAAAASSTHAGASSIASNVEHLRYGLSLLNAWVGGAPVPWNDADWTAAWKNPAVTELEWRARRDALRREATAWLAALSEPRELSERELRWVIGSIAHLAYHLGAIRQIDRATRGPTAEDERPYQTG